MNNGETPKEIYLADKNLISLIIGRKYGGGLIFHIDSASGNGIVALQESLTLKAKWGCYYTDIKNTSQKIGSGLANSTKIMAGCKEDSIAAKYCIELDNGKNDWYLPSIDEVKLIYKNLYLTSIGNYNTGTYWSSSQLSSAFGYTFVFKDEKFYTEGKSYNYNIIPVRSIN